MLFWAILGYFVQCIDKLMSTQNGRIESTPSRFRGSNTGSTSQEHQQNNPNASHSFILPFSVIFFKKNYFHRIKNKLQRLYITLERQSEKYTKLFHYHY